MKRFFALAAAATLVAGPVVAQTASVSQTGDNQTASVTQTGSPSNGAYVVQLTDNAGPQTSTVLQQGIGNYANVNMTEIGGGDHFLNTASLQQIGNSNQMWQSVYAPGYNSGQHVTAGQFGNLNLGVQSITAGYTDNLTLTQTGSNNTSHQTLQGTYGDGTVNQTGDYNIAQQTMSGANNGYNVMGTLIDQTGNANQAYQTLESTGGSTLHNDAQIDQNGDGNYAYQFGHGWDLKLYILEDGPGNVAYSSSTGTTDYVNLHLTNGAYANVLQNDGDGNTVQGLSAGSAAPVLDGGTLNVTQTGSTNTAFVSMLTGGTATVSQIGSTNTATVDQH